MTRLLTIIIAAICLAGCAGNGSEKQELERAQNILIETAHAKVWITDKLETLGQKIAAPSPLARNAWMIYAAGLAGCFGGGWLYTRGKVKAGAAIVGIGAAMLIVPSFLWKLEGMLVPLILCGLVAAGLFTIWKLSKRGDASFKKLAGEGRMEQAVAAKRAASPAYDAAPHKWRPLVPKSPPVFVEFEK